MNTNHNISKQVQIKRRTVAKVILRTSAKNEEHCVTLINIGDSLYVIHNISIEIQAQIKFENSAQLEKQLWDKSIRTAEKRDEYKVK